MKKNLKSILTCFAIFLIGASALSCIEDPYEAGPDGSSVSGGEKVPAKGMKGLMYWDSVMK